MEHRQRKSVLVAISLPHAASRQKLRGIYRYAARKSDWDISLVRSPSDLTTRLLDECASGKIDGFILSSDECSARIAQDAPLNKPIVAIEFGMDIPSARDSRMTVSLTTDNAAIGRMAANHFKSLGRFASFAYVPDEKGREWSKLRGHAFVDAVSSYGHHVEIYDVENEGLPAFLLRQKRPVAVFAAWDFLAVNVIKACHEAGLAVPAQVSVLGVDDDDLICESVYPALSTILIDRVKQGFIAARTLDMMMKSRETVHAPGYICEPLKVVERESTAHVSTGTAVVERASRFIDDHALEGIGVDDVADAIRVSRRLLDLRFAESGLGSVAGIIRAKKLAEAKRLLKQTSLSDSRIAMRCGFKNVGTLRNLFRKTCGMSMRVYRHRGARCAPKPGG